MNNDAQDLQNKAQELFIARDIIDMAKDYADDFDALEYLSGFAFSLARLHGDNIVDWDSIFSILDQAYSRKDSAVLSGLTVIYDKVVSHIESSK